MHADAMNPNRHDEHYGRDFPPRNQYDYVHYLRSVQRHGMTQPQSHPAQQQYGQRQFASEHGGTYGKRGGTFNGNIKRSNRMSGRQRGRRRPLSTMQTAKAFLPDEPNPEDHGISRQMLDELSSDSDVDALPAETIARLVHCMKTTIREKTLRWLREVADEKGHIPNNPVIAVLNNVTPARRHRQSIRGHVTS